MPADNQMFKGVRVIELAQYVFVPAAGAILADLGAEVIKIETVEGDPYRSMSIGDGREKQAVNISMEQNSRGKKSIGLDLKTAEGRELLLKLVEGADILLTSLRPQALERLRLGVDDLRARNPKLIYAHGNGLGFKGEEASRAGYDASAFWSRGGFGHVLARPGEPPVAPRPAFGDHTGAMSIAFGMAAALFNRERSGEAAIVEISLLGTGMWVLSSDMTMAARAADLPPAPPPVIRQNPLRGTYETSDGRFMQFVLLQPDKYWQSMCQRLSRMDLFENPDYASDALRIANGDMLIPELRATFKARPLAYWRAALKGWDAPFEVIQTIQEVVDDPQAVANDYLFTVRAADGSDVRLVAGPVAFNGSAVPPNPRRAPDFGQDSEALLGALNLSAAEISDLRARRIIA